MFDKYTLPLICKQESLGSLLTPKLWKTHRISPFAGRREGWGGTKCATHWAFHPRHRPCGSKLARGHIKLRKLLDNTAKKGAPKLTSYTMLPEVQRNPQHQNTSIGISIFSITESSELHLARQKHFILWYYAVSSENIVLIIGPYFRMWLDIV